MGKHKFDRKKAVRFSLVPGPEINGKPSVLFKPIESKNSKLNKKEKKKMFSELSDYDEITINGKAIEEDEIPAYVLEQIRGRKDLLFNEINGNMGDEAEEEEVGDLYDIQDGLDDDEAERVSYNVEEEKIIKEHEREEDYDSEDEQWSDDDEENDFEEIDGERPGIKIEEKKEQLYANEGQFPTLQEVHTVNIEGKQYKLTKKQIDMLDTVLPQNYENLNIGINFQKYDEDGLPLSQKEQNDKYFLKETDKVGIIDTYEYIPQKAVPVIDTDITPSQLKTDSELRDVEDALNYEGEDVAYDEIEDDFFAKLIQGEIKSGPVKEVQKKEQKVVKKSKQEKPKVKEVKKVDKPEVLDKQLDEQLDKAMYNFENNIEDKIEKDLAEDDSESDDEPTNKSISIMNYAELDKKEEYIGRDGELDWRMLTKKQKKQYMKTKVIKQGYDEMRERQIEQKMKGKSNVKVEDLHLKQLVKHIPYEQDHVMRTSLANGLKQNQEQNEEEDFSFSSQEDDIVSFHEKTSIIATNLSVIEEPHKEKKKKEKKNEDDESEANISRMKIVPEKRDRKETSEERKQRKRKLKDLKKEKREQKKQFAERFSKIKRETMKTENHTNTLKGVSYVKIY